MKSKKETSCAASIKKVTVYETNDSRFFSKEVDAIKHSKRLIEKEWLEKTIDVLENLDLPFEDNTIVTKMKEIRALCDSYIEEVYF